ncbi:hypothetical protein [Maritalea myrionectae]|uniref:hypothetical protein n=1 Tax=Maritalea myrionectae TaxID=454601 RepID=UPI000400DF92|nr:hypothetical protein [Maritalea myrionectae]
MTRTLQWLLVGWFLMLAVWMFFSPMSWYQITPGVKEMGPFNMHFVMDLGLVFFASAAAMAYGLYRHDKTAIVCGAFWPVLHATFHIFIWFQRGVPLDLIAFSNLFGIQLPAWAALFLAFKHPNRRVQNA